MERQKGKGRKAGFAESSKAENETLPVEYLGGKPLCMNQYYQILSSCRIPGPKRDSVFFQLDVYSSDGSPLTTDQIFIQLEKIWNTSLQTNKEPIGILTSNHRNSWAKAYNNLIKEHFHRLLGCPNSPGLG
ncbi:Carnitine O-acetyltransferase, partial [Ophiophagus hannah]